MAVRCGALRYHTATRSPVVREGMTPGVGARRTLPQQPLCDSARPLGQTGRFRLLSFFFSLFFSLFLSCVCFCFAFPPPFFLFCHVCCFALSLSFSLSCTTPDKTETKKNSRLTGGAVPSRSGQHGARGPHFAPHVPRPSWTEGVREGSCERPSQSRRAPNRACVRARGESRRGEEDGRGSEEGGLP